MTDQPAFSANYSNWRVIQGRKVIQIVFEIPLEAEPHAYRVLGGMPNVAQPSWFAIARLKEKPKNETLPET